MTFTVYLYTIQTAEGMLVVKLGLTSSAAGTRVQSDSCSMNSSVPSVCVCVQALSVGIFPYVLKLLQSSARELRPLLVFIWAKILAVDSVSY